MSNFNRVILMGNLTRDPELRYTPKGTAIVQCGLAVNRRWKGEDGEAKEEVTFVDFTAFGKTAETMAQYLKKGRPILFEGRLSLDQWDDKQTGQKRQKLKVVLESFQFVGGKLEDQHDDGSGQQQPEHTRRERPATAPAEPPGEQRYPDDDVPF